MIKRILVVGGANGIGLAIAQEMANRQEVEKVYVVDKAALVPDYCHTKIESFQFDLTSDDYSYFDRFTDIDNGGFRPVEPVPRHPRTPYQRLVQRKHHSRDAIGEKIL